MKNTFEKVMNKNSVLELIIRADFIKDGIEFFTPDDYSQQLAYMNSPAGYKITPHIHNKVQREVFHTQEVLFIKKGKVKINFYDDGQRCIDTRILKTGDVILLASGGHGFTMLESTEMIEVTRG